MRTLEQLIDTHGVDVDDHLDRAELVPVLAGMQRQGDVIVIPQRPNAAAHAPIPTEGIPVVRGENGGNTHLLLAVGPCMWAPNTTTDPAELTLGTLDVPDDAEAYLAHPEHGYVGIAPGSYRIGRQREMADEIRRVQD